MSPIKPENRDRYPKDWKGISLRIKERASWCCECEGECGHDHDGRCERKHNQMLPSERLDEFGSRTWFYVVLTVAHLDHQPENCTEENLKAMCQRCHLAYDAPRKRVEKRARMTEGMTPLFGDVAGGKP